MRCAGACRDAQTKRTCSSSASQLTITRGKMSISAHVIRGAAGHMGQAEASKPRSPSNVLELGTTATS